VHHLATILITLCLCFAFLHQYDISINFGVALGYLVGYLCQATLSSNKAWRVMFYFGIIPPACVLLFLWFTPESPRWLVSVGLRVEAVAALKRIGDDAAAETVKVIDRELILMREAQLDNNAHRAKKDNEAIMTAALIGLMQQISGSEAILYYSSNFLKEAGMTSDLSQMLGELAIGVSKLLPSLVLFNYYDDFGRRTFLIGSAAGVTAVLVALMVVFIAGDQPIVTVVLLCLFMVFFSCGLGPITCKTSARLRSFH
jgi:SP family sugar:H+ symporter-like MFS transporter